MPDNNLSIHGIQTFVPNPFAAGYVLNEAEAGVLFQTFRENISNGVRKKVAELQGEDKTFTEENAAKAKALIDEYASTYSFSAARTRGPSKAIDPLAAEIASMAKATVTARIKEKGLKLAEYDKEKFASLVAKASEHPDLVAAAKRRIEARKKASAGLELDV